jgi:hypothetical protein
VRVSHALNDSYLTFVVQLLQRCHVGVEGQLVINGEYLVFRNPDIRAIVKVKGIGIGNESVHKVIAA